MINHDFQGEYALVFKPAKDEGRKRGTGYMGPWIVVYHLVCQLLYILEFWNVRRRSEDSAPLRRALLNHVPSPPCLSTVALLPEYSNASPISSESTISLHLRVALSQYL